MMYYFSTFALVAVVLIVLGYCLYRSALPKPLPGIPYDRTAGESVWGDIPSIQADPDGLSKWCGRHLGRLASPVAQMLMGPFSKPVVLVADTPMAREILNTRSDFDRSSFIIDRFPLFGEFHLRMATDEHWRTSRGWMKDLLSPQYLHGITAESVHASTLKLIELWKVKLKKAGNAPFSMREDMKSLALDSIMHFYFGDRFEDTNLDRQVAHAQQENISQSVVGKQGEILFSHAPAHDFIQGLASMGDRITAIYAGIWPPGLVSWWTRRISSHYSSLFKAKDDFIRQHIDMSIRHIHTRGEAKSGIDHMVFREQQLASKSGREPLYGKQIMIDEVFGNLVAGEHTTSAAFVWILKFLTDKPDLQLRLLDELHSVFATALQEARIPTAHEILLAKTPFLDAVLEEFLRLRAAFVIPRDAIRDTQILGHVVPKGSVVLLVCQGADFSTPTFNPGNSGGEKMPGQARAYGNSDLDAFDPERWLTRKPDGTLEFDRSTHPQLGFGLGTRACWGQKLAQLEMRLVTAMLIWVFDFLEVPQALAGHEATYDISYRAKQGFVRLRSRV